jgi:hypothetical protein
VLPSSEAYQVLPHIKDYRCPVGSLTEAAFLPEEAYVVLLEEVSSEAYQVLPSSEVAY